jgi:hypothetical protein
MDKKVSEMEIQRAIRKVAQRSGMSPQRVRKNIEQMLTESRACPDPQAQAAWASIPCAGQTPTMEEVMNHILNQGQ